jgi:alpha-glucosidase
MTALGRRRDGSTRDELVARVYADQQPTSFTLYEDDGETVAYLSGAVRTTEITQRRDARSVRVTIGAAQGSYAGAPDARDNVLEIAARGVDGSAIRAVTVDGDSVARVASRAAFDAATAAAWLADDAGLVRVRSGRRAVSERTEVEIDLGAAAPG